MSISLSLSSSLDVLSLTSSSRWASDSPSDEDEIVWSLSSSAHLSTSPPLHSPLSETADFVLVPRATAAPAASPTADTIADEMASLSLTPVRGTADAASASAPQRTSVQGSTTTKKGKRAPRPQQAATGEQQAPTTAPPAAPRRRSRKGTKRTRGSSHGSTSSASSTGAAASSPDALPSRIKSAGKGPAKKAPAKRAGAAPSATGLGARAVVDDSVSETSESSTPPITTGYQEAHKYMTSYLAHPPPPGNKGSALLMLQALILELGCLPSFAAGKFAIPQLPATLRQAKILLKSHAFINVRDYLAVREQGQDALQRVMHPNRNSLVKEVRKGKRMPVGEVKRAGLNVLLVHTRF